MKKIWLFGESISSTIQIKIAQSIVFLKFNKGEEIDLSGLKLIKKGKVELNISQKNTQEKKYIIGKGDFWGGEKIIGYKHFSINANSISDTELYHIHDFEILKQIPIIRWKLLEQIGKQG